MGRPATDQTRTILDAAERILADRGPRAMTMDAVAAEAGVGKGTVFLYWPSKARLLQAVLALDVAEVGARLAQEVRDRPEELSLAWLVEQQLRTAWDRPLLMGLFVDLPATLAEVDGLPVTCRPQDADPLPELVDALLRAGVVDPRHALADVVDDTTTVLVGTALAGIKEPPRQERLVGGVRRLLGGAYAPPSGCDTDEAARRVAALLDAQVDTYVDLARPDRPTAVDLHPAPRAVPA